MYLSKKVGFLVVGLATMPALVMGATTPSTTPLAGSKVDNFMLADQTGMGHELYYYGNNAAVVVVTSAQGDKVSARAVTAVAKVRDAFKGKHVLFLMLDSSLQQ